MRILMISYDVIEPSAAEALASAIKSSAVRWARPLASTWVIETDADAAEVEAHLAPLLGLDDGMIIQEVAAAMPAVSNTVMRWSGIATTSGGEVIPWRRSKVAEAA